MGRAPLNQDPTPFFAGKRVMVTGHTGFTGVWMCHWLLAAGAEVSGFALAPEADQPLNLFATSGLGRHLDHTIGDIRDPDAVNAAFERVKPDIVFHLAAQPLVRLSYREPELTYATNVMGTLHVLQAARQSGAGQFVNITSDKAYENREWVWGYRENDPMGGHDPYSSSKGCADILARSFWLSYGQGEGAMQLATGRAGNIIGGGDWAMDRLVPDIARAFQAGDDVIIRRPSAVRPWQHVIEAVRGYMQLAAALGEGRFNGEAMNFGPQAENMVEVGTLATAIADAFGRQMVEINPDSAPEHEANLLRLDITKARVELGWTPVLDFEETVQRTAQFYKAMIQDSSAVADLLSDEITDYRARLVQG